jgi:hypothetical protein
MPFVYEILSLNFDEILEFNKKIIYSCIQRIFTTNVANNFTKFNIEKMNIILFLIGFAFCEQKLIIKFYDSKHFIVDVEINNTYCNSVIVL